MWRSRARSPLPPYAVERGLGPLGRVYDAVVSGTAVPSPPLLSATTRCYTRVAPSDLRLKWVRGGVHDAAVPGTAVSTPSLLASCIRYCVLVRIGPFGAHV